MLSDQIEKADLQEASTTAATTAIVVILSALLIVVRPTVVRAFDSINCWGALPVC